VTSPYQTQQRQQQVDFRSVTTCFRLATKSSSSGGGAEFYRLRRLLRRAKRQAADRDDADDKDSEEDLGVSRYPLYCIVCRVQLNAQLQAKQHYKGRSHARRVRLLYGAPAITAGTPSDPAFTSTLTNTSSYDSEVSSVYCCFSIMIKNTNSISNMSRKSFSVLGKTFHFFHALHILCRLIYSIVILLIFRLSSA